MNNYLKTKCCVVCGRSAVMWAGCVTGYRKMALGNLYPVKIFAGRCFRHMDSDIPADQPFKISDGISNRDLRDRPVVQEMIFGE